ncbi:hypothetical protein [Vibrio harveyi]|uniref:hypothetical protein n=1 Tax=Vibrio harveyi TaxID=669 RepID=UPI00126304D1|nr:hypothetical protein [Vibrio harveyi]QFQ77029.1 hypothetical protein F9277_06040 [Vibrio harveyi]
MITADGIIGKLVTLIVTKTIGKMVDLPFDKRKKACRSLTKLYYCVQTLDEVTDEFFETFNDFESNGVEAAVVHALNNNMHKLEQASNMFIELGSELRGGLEIIDPALANCCNALYVSKVDFLSYLSKSVEWDRSGETPVLNVLLLKESLLNVDLESLYNKTEIALNKGDNYYWVTSVFDEFDAQFEEIEISFSSEDSAHRLMAYVEQQSLLLKQARDSLRLLLKDNFSIEEVLYQSDSHPFK